MDILGGGVDSARDGADFLMWWIVINLRTCTAKLTLELFLNLVFRELT